jgi:hypothetical protein
LAERLAGSDSYLLEAEEPCDLARCQLCETAWVIPKFLGPRLVELNRPNVYLQEADKVDSSIRIGQPIQEPLLPKAQDA